MKNLHNQNIPDSVTHPKSLMTWGCFLSFFIVSSSFINSLLYDSAALAGELKGNVNDMQNKKKIGKKCSEISTWLTFKHLNGHCSRIRPPLKSYCRSLGNLSKSTFTNDFFDGNVMSWNFPGAFCWTRRLVTWTCTLCFSIIFPGFSETHVLWRRLPGCAWNALTWFDIL